MLLESQLVGDLFVVSLLTGGKGFGGLFGSNEADTAVKSIATDVAKIGESVNQVANAVNQLSAKVGEIDSKVNNLDKRVDDAWKAINELRRQPAAPKAAAPAKTA